MEVGSGRGGGGLVECGFREAQGHCGVGCHGLPRKGEVEEEFGATWVEAQGRVDLDAAAG